MRTVFASSVLVLAAALAATGCHRAAATATTAASASSQPEYLVQPGAPGQASTELPPDAKLAFRQSHTQADTQFMQGMIHHHAQALQMTALVYTHTDNPKLLLLAKKIDNSQSDEIRWMDTWLSQRGETVPKVDHGMVMMAGMDMPMMPGMLTPAQMDALAAARGRQFDRLFLTGMIQHHTGALQMVQDLLATPGAAMESTVSNYITNVDTDQRQEIDLMRALLKELR